MNFHLATYSTTNSPVAALDARVKLVLLFFYSCALFFVSTWAGMIILSMLFAVVVLLSKVSITRMVSLGIPVYVIAAFALVFALFNATSYTASFPAAVAPISLGVWGSPRAGWGMGCFVALRIILLTWASLVVCFTSSSMQLTSALTSLLQPLRRVGVPVADVALVLSLALRFIPLTADEFARIQATQLSRGAPLYRGNVWVRVRAWSQLFIPLFVGLFRRADTVARALDARCYGACPCATPRTNNFSRSDGATLAVCSVFIIAVAVAL